MFKFIHAADLHLDSPLYGLERYSGAPTDAIRGATRGALRNLVQLAIDEEVAFVLIAGDIYDGDWKEYNTGLFFIQQMSRLQEAGITVYVISGNHDAESVISRNLTLPDNVRVFAAKHPETHIHEATDTALHGQGFATRAVTSDISQAYPRKERRSFNIGLLHTCATGLEGHEPYAPCTIEGLVGHEYDYWALGHIHQRQILRAESPVIAFSGNLQGRHVRETGPKGCLLVTVDQGVPTPEFRPLDVFRWEHIELDVSASSHPDDAILLASDRIATLQAEHDALPMAVRLTLTGPTPLHLDLVADQSHWEQELRARVTPESHESVWVERVRIKTQSPLAETAIEMDGPLAELRSLMSELPEDQVLQAALADEMQDLYRKLPKPLRDELLIRINNTTDIKHPGWITTLGQEAGDQVLGRIAQQSTKSK